VRTVRQRGSCLGERIATAHLDASTMLPGLPEPAATSRTAREQAYDRNRRCFAELVRCP
jgi:hypothetical protein